MTRLHGTSWAEKHATIKTSASYASQWVKKEALLRYAEGYLPVHCLAAFTGLSSEKHQKSS
jgi:hypothetical protein